MVKKTKGQELAGKILTDRKSLVDKPSAEDMAKADEFCVGYKAFLNNKTEREVVDYVLPILAEHGYKEYKRGTKYRAGSKFYKVNRGKTILMCTKGRRPVAEGVRVSVAHIDSPRLDFKPHPLFEDASMAYFKTHYYGGIKKYQWTTIPLSVRGVVYTKKGEKVTVKIGEGEDEPALLITDLLPHLAQTQMRKTAGEVVEGEQLNLLIGSIPYDDEKVKDRVKLAVMKILNDKYGITEDDFETAELCAVPAFIPRDMGLDRSMIAAYGQDDSSCAYAEFMAELDTKSPEYTTVTIFADKEETGSDGVTGMRSFFFRDFLEDLAQDEGCEVRDVLRHSVCLSCDVSAGLDPAWPEVMERNNCCFMNRGPCLAKYDGSRGKYSTNDASAEMMNYVISIFRDAGVSWQIGELGKIDQGGGGTIASEISVHSIDTVDIGVPVLSMHAPIEVTCKADVYMLYKAVRAVYDSKRPKDF
ncbi:MAG: aminopeptidase [Thermoplasmata archaeon]|nr:aminopeptidase [Thermoplasmata archaeon]